MGVRQRWGPYTLLDAALHRIWRNLFLGNTPQNHNNVAWTRTWTKMKTVSVKSSEHAKTRSPPTIQPPPTLITINVLQIKHFICLLTALRLSLQSHIFVWAAEMMHFVGQLWSLALACLHRLKKSSLFLRLVYDHYYYYCYYYHYY